MLAVAAGALLLHFIVLTAYLAREPMQTQHISQMRAEDTEDPVNWELIRRINGSDAIKDPDSRSELGQDTWVLSHFDKPGAPQPKSDTPAEISVCMHLSCRLLELHSIPIHYRH